MENVLEYQSVLIPLNLVEIELLQYYCLNIILKMPNSVLKSYVLLTIFNRSSDIFISLNFI